jgi:hypothetical protein
METKMPSPAFKKALASDLPVLFVNIGWAIRYDGTEIILGNHGYIKEHPGAKVGESGAFARNNGLFRCGIGTGQHTPSPLHIVFVARDPGDQFLKVVGVYVAAEVSINADHWAVARTRLVERIPIEKRRPVVGWPGTHGMRRWARQNGEPEHENLLALFLSLAEGLERGDLPEIEIGAAEDDDGHEGELKTLLVRHRKREHKFRAKKITDVMQRNDGRLICEVPHCGFDFHARYGELGVGFVEVHHKKPLSQAPRRGRSIRLSDLAVVCANCHRMIHRHGQCRPLERLISE